MVLQLFVDKSELGLEGGKWKGGFVVVSFVQGTTVFDVWFRVDARPFKQALLNIVKRWSFMFKQHLIDHVTDRWEPGVA